jgi:hypothetical protein
MKELELTQSEMDERLAASVTSYGRGTKSYNSSAEKRESKAQQKTVTEKYLAEPHPERIVGPICTCRSFNLSHEISRHKELGSRGDMEWRIESERHINYSQRWES